MTRTRAAAITAAVLAALLLGTLGGCGGDEDAEDVGSNSRSTVTSMATTTGPAGSATSSTSVEQGGDLVVVLRRAVEEERNAEATYRNVIATLGEILPFINIADSEARHVAALEQLSTKHGVDISDIDPAGSPSPSSKPAACAMGVAAEQADIALYDELLPQVTAYPDVTQVLQNLRAASQDEHLPAFERCA